MVLQPPFNVCFKRHNLLYAISVPLQQTEQPQSGTNDLKTSFFRLRTKRFYSCFANANSQCRHLVVFRCIFMKHFAKLTLQKQKTRDYRIDHFVFYYTSLFFLFSVYNYFGLLKLYRLIMSHQNYGGGGGEKCSPVIKTTKQFFAVAQIQFLSRLL